MRRDKLEHDLECRRKRILDAVLSRHSLQGSERLVGLPPLEDEKEPCQLLRKIRKMPCELGRETLPSDGGSTPKKAAGRAFTASIRGRWYRARIALYQLSNRLDPARVDEAAKSSGFPLVRVYCAPRRGFEPRT